MGNTWSVFSPPPSQCSHACVCDTAVEDLSVFNLKMLMWPSWTNNCNLKVEESKTLFRDIHHLKVTIEKASCLVHMFFSPIFHSPSNCGTRGQKPQIGGKWALKRTLQISGGWSTSRCLPQAGKTILVNRQQPQPVRALFSFLMLHLRAGWRWGSERCLCVDSCVTVFQSVCALSDLQMCQGICKCVLRFVNVHKRATWGHHAVRSERALRVMSTAQRSDAFERRVVWTWPYLTENVNLL